ncbi:DUF916 domain-containing protein [uncultured Microbacterium sp.]|uniref:WxL protein peptidoglycan domain-containing protein n=1 Tax=uncultured Microbacterium sp. TaxID=191216 RepID=UPI002605ADD5|nr:DUF916 domain-containing protein [uncultured Microbacterium sp.]
MLRRPRSPRALLGPIVATVLVALTASMTSALSAHADDTPVAADAQQAADGQVAWSMIPVITDIGEERSNFSYALDPGESVEDAVLIRNSGSAPVDLAVHGSDAFTNESGSLEIATVASEGGVSTWIAPSVDNVHVEPGELVRIPFRVTAPSDALPGEHAGALLTVLESAGETVSVDMRYATRVTVGISGELTAGLALEDASLSIDTGFWPWEPALAEISYSVRNTGNTRLSAMQLVSGGGVEEYSSAESTNGLLPLNELLPGAGVEVDAALPGLHVWSPVTAIEVSVSPTILTNSAASELPLPAVEQQQLSLSTVAIAPGTWVIAAGALVAVLLVIRRIRRPSKK